MTDMKELLQRALGSEGCERLKDFAAVGPAQLAAVELFADRLLAAIAQLNEPVAAEREACARVADLVAREIDDTNGLATYIAKHIRARGEK